MPCGKVGVWHRTPPRTGDVNFLIDLKGRKIFFFVMMNRLKWLNQRSFTVKNIFSTPVKIFFEPTTIKTSEIQGSRVKIQNRRYKIAYKIGYYILFQLRARKLTLNKTWYTKTQYDRMNIRIVINFEINKPLRNKIILKNACKF